MRRMPLTAGRVPVPSFALMCSAQCGAHLFLSPLHGDGMAVPGAVPAFFQDFFVKDVCYGIVHCGRSD